MENKKSQGVLNPSLCPPREQDDSSVVGVYSNQENSKMVRGEDKYRTRNPQNPAHGKWTS